MWMGLTCNQKIPLPTHRNISNTELCTSQVCTLAPSCFFPGVAAVIFHCVSSCSSNLRDVSNSPWWVSWTSRNRKFVNPNRTSSRQSEKSTNRLCKEFWAMSRSSSSMWIVNLGKRTKVTIDTWVWDDVNIVNLTNGCLLEPIILNRKYSHRDSRSMSSGLDIPSGRMRGMAATHVLNKSILGFLSPLKKFDVEHQNSLLQCNKSVEWGLT